MLFLDSSLRTQYYDHFSAFKETIDSTIDAICDRSKRVIDKLIDESVQIFDNTLAPINGNSFAAGHTRGNKAAIVA